MHYNKRLRELFSFEGKVIMESPHHTKLLYKELAVLKEQLAKITMQQAKHQCNKQQSGLNNTNVPASARVKFGEKVNVASIDGKSHHPIIHDTPTKIDDSKCTAGKVGSISFWKLPTKTF